MKVRKISMDETDFLENLHNHKNFAHYKKKVEDRIFRRVADVYVLEINEKIIGEITVHYGEKSPMETIAGRRVYFSAFRILPEYRGNGYGKMFLNEITSLLESEGYTEFTIGVEDSNEKAAHIYKTLGFTKIIANLSEIYEGDYYEYKLLLKD